MTTSYNHRNYNNRNSYNSRTNRQYNFPDRSSETTIELDSHSYIYLHPLMGSNGKVFKAITEICELDFIWYDFQTNTIHLWGTNKDKLENAIKRIQDRIMMLEESYKESINEYYMYETFKKINNGNLLTEFKEFIEKESGVEFDCVSRQLENGYNIIYN